MWIVSPPRPEAVRPLIEALLALDWRKAWGLLQVLPNPWGRACRDLKPARGDQGPLLALYVAASYCAWRSRRKPISPLERNAWVDLHTLAVGGMSLRRRGAPSKRLAFPLPLSLRLTYDWLKNEIENLEQPTPAAIRSLIERYCHGSSPTENLIQEVLIDRVKGRRGRTWPGLQKVLAAWVGIGPSEFRKQVAERSRKALGRKRQPLAWFRELIAAAQVEEQRGNQDRQPADQK